MVRRFEQGEQVPLLKDSRSSLALVHPDLLLHFDSYLKNKNGPGGGGGGDVVGIYLAEW